MILPRYLEKEEHFKSKSNRRKNIIKIGAEFSKIENRKIQKSNEKTFEKINEINRLSI